MTNIEFSRNDCGNIVKVELSGHTGYGEDGSDIVCAAVSASLYMTLNGLEEVVGLQFGYEIKDGYSLIVIPGDTDAGKQREADVLLKSMMVFCGCLQDDYPENISLTVLEV